MWSAILSASSPSPSPSPGTGGLLQGLQSPVVLAALVTGVLGLITAYLVARAKAPSPAATSGSSPPPELSLGEAYRELATWATGSPSKEDPPAPALATLSKEHDTIALTRVDAIRRLRGYSLASKDTDEWALEHETAVRALRQHFERPTP